MKFSYDTHRPYSYTPIYQQQNKDSLKSKIQKQACLKSNSCTDNWRGKMILDLRETFRNIRKTTKLLQQEKQNKSKLIEDDCKIHEDIYQEQGWFQKQFDKYSRKNLYKMVRSKTLSISYSSLQRKQTRLDCSKPYKFFGPDSSKPKKYEKVNPNNYRCQFDGLLTFMSLVQKQDSILYAVATQDQIYSITKISITTYHKQTKIYNPQQPYKLMTLSSLRQKRLRCMKLGGCQVLLMGTEDGCLICSDIKSTVNYNNYDCAHDNGIRIQKISISPVCEIKILKYFDSHSSQCDDSNLWACEEYCNFCALTQEEQLFVFKIVRIFNRNVCKNAESTHDDQYSRYEMIPLKKFWTNNFSCLINIKLLKMGECQMKHKFLTVIEENRKMMIIIQGTAKGIIKVWKIQNTKEIKYGKFRCRSEKNANIGNPHLKQHSLCQCVQMQLNNPITINTVFPLHALAKKISEKAMFDLEKEKISKGIKQPKFEQNFEQISLQSMRLPDQSVTYLNRILFMDNLLIFGSLPKSQMSTQDNENKYGICRKEQETDFDDNDSVNSFDKMNQIKDQNSHSFQTQNWNQIQKYKELIQQKCSLFQNQSHGKQQYSESPPKSTKQLSPITQIQRIKAYQVPHAPLRTSVEPFLIVSSLSNMSQLLYVQNYGACLVLVYGNGKLLLVALNLRLNCDQKQSREYEDHSHDGNNEIYQVLLGYELFKPKNGQYVNMGQQECLISLNIFQNSIYALIKRIKTRDPNNNVIYYIKRITLNKYYQVSHIHIFFIAKSRYHVLMEPSSFYVRAKGKEINFIIGYSKEIVEFTGKRQRCQNDVEEQENEQFFREQIFDYL